MLVKGSFGTSLGLELREKEYRKLVKECFWVRLTAKETRS